LPAVYVETENGEKTLRRGKTLPAGSKALVVDDVLTTGRSLVETRDALAKAGAETVAMAVLIDRSPAGLDLGCPLYGAYKVESVSYAPDEVPDWLATIPIHKPGTRAV
jgi:orotate phosphoribosyltransferase